MSYGYTEACYVTVRKDELLKKLRENKEQHRTIFLKAIELFREEAIRVFEKNLEAAKSNKPFQVKLNIERPRDHTEEYQRAIEMLEWSTKDEVEISEQDFKCFVQDNWDWQTLFLSNKYVSDTVSAPRT